MTETMVDVAPEVARALDLNKAMIDMALEREGLAKIGADQMELLRGASLAELAKAAGIVKAHDAARPSNPDGSRSFMMTCDDRIVAAIYAFLHFTLPPASDPDDDDYIILKLTDTTHVYFLVSGAREIEAEDDEEE